MDPDSFSYGFYNNKKTTQKEILSQDLNPQLQNGNYGMNPDVYNLEKHAPTHYLHNSGSLDFEYNQKADNKNISFLESTSKNKTHLPLALGFAVIIIVSLIFLILALIPFIGNWIKEII